MAFDLIGRNIEYKGYLKNDGSIFVFFGSENLNYIFKKFQSNNKYWWCLIDEICNKQMVINYKFHKSVTNVFFSNKELIYLYDEDGKQLEIPTIVFRGDHIDILSYLAAFGQRRSTRSRFGPFYTLGTFNWAIRWAGWSKNYQKHIFKGKNISDDNGKYKKGGIIRLAVFLGDLEENYVVINNKRNYFSHLINFYDRNSEKSMKEIEEHHKRRGRETGKWSTHYKSLVIPKIKFKNNSGYFNINTEFLVSDSNDKITISLHELDMSTLKSSWDPLSENYRIL